MRRSLRLVESPPKRSILGKLRHFATNPDPVMESASSGAHNEKNRISNSIIKIINITAIICDEIWPHQSLRLSLDLSDRCYNMSWGLAGESAGLCSRRSLWEHVKHEIEIETTARRPPSSRHEKSYSSRMTCFLVLRETFAGGVNFFWFTRFFRIKTNIFSRGEE